MGSGGPVPNKPLTRPIEKIPEKSGKRTKRTKKEGPLQTGKLYERRQKLITQIHADLVFQACISF